MAKQWFNKRWWAFTMAEVVIVLGLVAVVIVTTTVPYQKRSVEQSEEQFWRNVRQRWQEAQTRARVEHITTYIYLRNQEGRGITFSYLRGGKFVNERVHLPKSLKIYTGIRTVSIYQGGFVSPQTWVFVSPETRTEYDMKIQMGWGGYRVEKKSISKHAPVISNR
ncbi:MAG: prepilin-type cleavage/methylation domain-containing protein [Limosilactobacillus gorillae]|jgi:competence protein ComGD|nr:prepilin-type cleavage/methylation domain-containing protein [Limosilactobacillus gorillae]